MPRKPDPTRRRLELELDEDLIEAIGQSIAGQVAKAQRVAVRAALELDREDKDDKRTGALAIQRALAQAGRLAEFSEVLLAAWVDAGGKAPTVAAMVVAEAATVVEAPTPEPSREETIAGLRAELDRLNGDEDPSPPTPAPPPPGAVHSLADAPPALPTVADVAAEAARAIATGGAEDKHVTATDVDDALAAIDGSGTP